MGSRVTTKNGDDGTTRTLAGDLVPKSSIILECTGGVDALRAEIALLRARVIEQQPRDHEAVAAFLLWFVHALFLVGTEVNDPERKHTEYWHEPLAEKHLKHIEAEQARLEAALSLPRAFIACASTVLAAQVDVAATRARDLERNLVRLKQAVPVFNDETILPFINRASDYLYILARYLEDGHHLPVDYSILS